MDENREVLKLTLTAVSEQSAHISIRLRGEGQWLYYEIEPACGDTVSFFDGQNDDSLAGGGVLKQFSQRPRDE